MTIANAALRSGLDDIEIAVLGYGGFNDMATAFTGSSNPIELFDARAKISDVYPLEIHVNDELYRYAVMYSSMGWTALISAIMDDPELREIVQNSNFKIPTTLFAVVKNYFQKKKIPLPDFVREGYPNEDHTGVTDVLHINGPNTAKLIRSGKRYFEGDTFLQTDLDVSNLASFGNINFLGRSALNLITGSSLALPGREVIEDVLTFDNATFGMQEDGEMKIMENVNSVSTTKSQNPLHFVTTK